MPLRRPSLYVEIVRRLEERILSGDLPEGSRLPSEEALALEHVVSRGTVREALHVLEMGGLVVRQQGRGSFVRIRAHDRIKGGLESLEDLVTLMRRWGHDAHEDLIAVVSTSIENPIALRIGVEAGTPGYLIESLKVTEQGPSVYCRDSVPWNIAHEASPDTVRNIRRETCSHLGFLERLGHRRDYAVCTVKAVGCDGPTQEHLKIPPQSTVLRMDAVIYDVNGVALSYSEMYFRDDVFEFFFIRR